VLSMLEIKLHKFGFEFVGKRKCVPRTCFD
jgi:hypothetical protein